MPQRADPVQPAIALGRVDRPHLPDRAVLAGEAALLDDAQQPVADVRRDTEPVQSLVRLGQQPVQHQLGHRHIAQPRPVQRRVDPLAGRAVEVLLRGAERQLRPYRTIRLGQLPGQSEVERRVGEHVLYGGPGRHDPVLHPQVRPAVHHVVHRPVPPVDSAVVQAQLAEPGDLPGAQRLHRVLVLADWQQRREVPDVFLEQVEDRGDPALPEPDPRAYSLSFELVRPGVGGLLEQRDAGLRPQLATEEIGRVGTQRDLDRGDGLRGVPVTGERLRRDLQVELHAGAGRLRRDGVGGGLQPFGAADVQLEIFATGADHLLVQHSVARVGGEVLQDGMLVGQGRQDADQYDPGVGLGRTLVSAGEAGLQLPFVVGQPVPLDQPRAGVELQVEQTEFGLERGVGQQPEHFRVAHRRLLVRADQAQLDLQSGHRPVRVEPELVQHQGEDVQTPAHLAPVTCPVLPGERGLRNAFAHSTAPPGRVPRSAPLTLRVQAITG